MKKGLKSKVTSSPKSYSIGIDLGASQIKYGIVSAKGKVLIPGNLPTPVRPGRKAVISSLQQIAEQLFNFAKKNKIQIKAIGIGSPGCINLKTGVVLGSCPNLPFWQGVNLKKIFQKYSLPVFADNDANLVALAESKFGIAKNYNNVVCLTIGSGIGGGIILNGEVYRGSNYAAGEIGHTSVNFLGEKCNCGTLGCLEAYASVNSILKRSQRLVRFNKNSFLNQLIRENGNQLSLDILFQALRKKDKIAQKIIEQTCDILSSGIANLVNILNPEIVVIGGGLVEVDSNIIRRIERIVKLKAFPTATKYLKIKRASLGNQAGFIGAGYWAIEESN